MQETHRKRGKGKEGNEKQRNKKKTNKKMEPLSPISIIVLYKWYIHQLKGRDWQNGLKKQKQKH